MRPRPVCWSSTISNPSFFPSGALRVVYTRRRPAVTSTQKLSASWFSDALAVRIALLPRFFHFCPSDGGGLRAGVAAALVEASGLSPLPLAASPSCAAGFGPKLAVNQSCKGCGSFGSCTIGVVSRAKGALPGATPARRANAARLGGCSDHGSEAGIAALSNAHGAVAVVNACRCSPAIGVGTSSRYGATYVNDVWF